MNKKHIAIGTLVLCGMIGAPYAHAEENTMNQMQPRVFRGGPNQHGEVNRDLRANVENLRQNVIENKKSIFDDRKDMRGDIKELREGMNKDNHDEVKKEIEDRRQAGKEGIQAKKEENKNTRGEIKDVRKEIIKNRYTAMVERLNGIASRVDSRLTKLAAEGKDVTAAKAKLAQVKDTIILAQTKGAAIAANTSTDLEANKKAMEEVRTLLKNAHTMLVEIVDSIKVAPKTTPTK